MTDTELLDKLQESRLSWEDFDSVLGDCSGNVRLAIAIMDQPEAIYPQRESDWKMANMRSLAEEYLRILQRGLEISKRIAEQP